VVTLMDVSQLFKGQKLDVECPNCKKIVTFDASLAFKNHSKITCQSCNSEIDLDTTDAKKAAEKAVKDLEKLFK
jgi:transposase-like protein